MGDDEGATTEARQAGRAEGVMYPDGDYVISESSYRELVGDGTVAELQAAYEWLHLQLSPSLEPIADFSLWNRRLAQLSTYIRERSSAGLPEVGVSLTFDGHTLSLGSESWCAVSGLLGVGEPLSIPPSGSVRPMRARFRLVATGSTRRNLWTCVRSGSSNCFTRRRGDASRDHPP